MALKTDANTDYGLITDGSFLNNQKLTFAFLMYYSDQSTYQQLISYPWDGADRLGLGLDGGTGGGDDRINTNHYVGGQGYSQYSADQSMDPYANKWIWIFHTLDSSIHTGGHGKLYVCLLNGTITADLVSGEANPASAQTLSLAGGADVYLLNTDTSDAARCTDPVAVGMIFVGDILTTTELQNIANDRMWAYTLPSLKAHYEFGLHGAGTIPDLSGNGNHATGNSLVLDNHPPIPAPFGRLIQVPHVAAAGVSKSVAGDMGRFAGSVTRKLMAKRTVSGAI